ncbi:MAG: hypothetical protein PW735_06530 [Acidobacteriaceae bacterium]|nr:hypothetical protein [Acidobacteriaceae bacterium]
MNWKKAGVLAVLAAFAVPCALAQAGNASAPTAEVAAAPTALCCGVVSYNGKYLDAVIDSMHVDSLWQPRVHIDWLTGQQDQPSSSTGPDRATHCSSFTAALGLRLNVYMLRPPQHPQQLLASAQARWFHTSEGRKDGWEPLGSAAEAQTHANQGDLVVVVYESPDEHRPGHIAIVRPYEKTSEELEKDGVETAQAGALNFSNGVARNSFAKHEGAWPNGVKYYTHVVDWDALRTKWAEEKKK